MHRRALLLDSGAYRNATVAHAHNLLGHDGDAPADLRQRGRDELAAYPTVEVRDATVTAVATETDSVRVEVGGETLRAAHVILATGLADDLPPIPGLTEHWGDRVANCPFCHGHEFAGRPVAILNASPHAEMLRGMLAPVASEVRVWDPARVQRVDPAGGDLRLTLDDGTEADVAGVFVAPTTRQRAPFAADLGLEMTDAGAVRVDAFGQTSVGRVFAVGDMAQPDHLPGPMASLAAAIADGQLAAIAIVRRLATP
ncbi:hypothetical protein LUZ63_022731 [Rhynchospora breviuscula]|uniref:FAD/NAD(P)-binding domain-containing protein n=1 Tax=Rhynchospora breviuscula TaxID=2022672 RepID=A0A9P9Z461_9POAL|nr:hypothetical protein LUZ63_022731 [Rhynchospora breviuscula]